jgi:hypothetical protein
MLYNIMNCLCLENERSESTLEKPLRVKTSCRFFILCKRIVMSFLYFCENFNVNLAPFCFQLGEI